MKTQKGVDRDLGVIVCGICGEVITGSDEGEAHEAACVAECGRSDIEDLLWGIDESGNCVVVG